MKFKVVANLKTQHSILITEDDPDKAYEKALDIPREEWTKHEMEEWEIEAVEHIYEDSDDDIIDAEIVEE